MRLLVLDSNSLHGNIPTALGDLYYLRVLWLQNNAISGTIPTELKEHLGAYDEDLGYSFDPGGVILTPNRFNCSIINGVGMDWANNTLDNLFRDNIAPKGYNQRGQDKGCIEDEGDLIINNVTIVQQQELFLEAVVTDNPIIRVIAVVRRATCRHPHTPPLAPIASCSPSPSPPPTRHHPPTHHERAFSPQGSWRPARPFLRAGDTRQQRHRPLGRAAHAELWVASRPDPLFPARKTLPAWHERIFDFENE